MNKSHKGHTITVSTARLPKTRQWETRLVVIWSEDGEGRLRRLTVNRSFRGREDAEREGLKFAKAWIDEGKPELSQPTELTEPTEPEAGINT